MKKEYKTPVIEITNFHTEDIITSSSVAGETTTTTTTTAAVPLPVEEIPPVLDGNDVFYN